MLLQSTEKLTSGQFESVVESLFHEMKIKYPNDEANIKIWEDAMTGPSAYQFYEKGFNGGSEKHRELKELDFPDANNNLVRKLGTSDVDDVATMHTGIKSKALMLSSLYRAFKKIDSKVKNLFGIESDNVKVKNVKEASNGKLLVEVEHVDGRALDKKVFEVDVTDASSKTMSYIQETDSDTYTKVGPLDIDTEIKSDVSHSSSGKLYSNQKVDKVNKFLGAYGVLAGLKAGEQSITAGNVEGIIQGFGQSAHAITTMIRFKGLSISDKIFQKVGLPVLKTIGKTTTKALGPLKKLVSENGLVVAKKLGSKFGNLANRLPYVGIGFGIWSVVNDAKALANAETTEDQVRFGIYLALDSASLTLDVVQAFFPELIPILAPISLAITLVEMFIDVVWDSVSSLIKQVDCSNGTSTVSCIFQYAAAVIEGTFIGIGKTVASLFYNYPSEEVKATEDFQKEFYILQNYFNTTREFGIVNFAAGKYSGYGGNVDFNLSSGMLCIKIDRKNRCDTLQIQPKFTNIALGIGQTHNIMYTAREIKILTFIPVGSVKVKDGLEGDSTTLKGTYHGNEQNNQFLAIDDLPAHLDDYLDYELADYTYHLFGHGGDDTFHLGPQTFFIAGTVDAA